MFRVFGSLVVHSRERDYILLLGRMSYKKNILAWFNTTDKKPHLGFGFGVETLGFGVPGLGSLRI